jgi:multidrug efflux pump subunit AcrA (membrane-fusion protein)
MAATKTRPPRRADKSSFGPAPPDGVDALRERQAQAIAAHQGASAALVAAETAARAARDRLRRLEEELRGKAMRDTLRVVLPIREAIREVTAEIEAAERDLLAVHDEEAAALAAEFDARRRLLYAVLARYLPRRADALAAEIDAARKGNRAPMGFPSGWDAEGHDDSGSIRTLKSKLGELARLGMGDPVGRDGLGRKRVDRLDFENWDPGASVETPEGLREQADRFAASAAATTTKEERTI